MEPRLALDATGFMQGFAFVDADGDNHFDSGELPKVGATIELRSADGNTLLATDVTDAAGYYRFDNVASGTYQLVEIPTLGYVNQGVEYSTVLSSVTSTLPNTITVDYVNPDEAAAVSIVRKPGLPGAPVSFTVAGGPFNSFTQPDDAHQFQISIDGQPDIYSFCMDLFHANPANYPATPSTTPMSPASTTNLGRIGYLYNTFGTKLLSATDGAGLSTAFWELLYDASPDLTSGNFKLGPGSSDAAAVAAANSFLALSAGQDQLAFFLNVSTPVGNVGDQGMIATEFYNFANNVPQLGSLTGKKFNDLDGDGTDDGGTDAGLAGWTIELDKDANGTVDATTVTGPGGVYTFTGLTVGTYRVREVGQVGWIQTTVNPGDVSVVSGTNSTGNNFGNFQLGSLTGKKFNDLDGDGTDDGGTDAGLAGWTIELDKDANGTVDATTVTGPGGVYTFTGLTVGTYRVREVGQVGWIQTTVNPGDVSVVSGTNSTGNNFGNFQLGSLTGKKFNDLDGDGTDDGGTDAGLAGWTIELDKDANGTVDATTVTGPGGVYTFTGLTVGTYRVREVGQVGWIQTTVNPGDVSVVSGTNSTGNNFGNRKLTPNIELRKLTNGVDANSEAEAPLIAPGAVVTWTYEVKNTGELPYTTSQIVITDDAGTPGTTADDFSTTSGAITRVVSSDVGNDGILAPGETWTYTASAIAQNLTTTGASSTFILSGNTAVTGSSGNIRTFTAGGVSVHASAFGRSASGVWSTAYLGSYGGGLGVTDGADGTGSNNQHTVDNGGSDNYVLFEFSESVIVDSAFLGFVVDDSDLTIWIGNVTNAFNSHIALSDAALTALGFTEVNTTTLTTTRTADFNGGSRAGNVLVIASKTGETNDKFKIEKLKVQTVEHACYENYAVVVAGGDPTGSDVSYYCNPPAPVFGRLSGAKYLDITGNGTSADDTGLGGTTIQLYRDANNDGILTAADGAAVATTVTTAGTGAYAFENVAAGRYFVKEVVADGYLRTSLTEVFTVVVSADSNTGNLNFTNFDKSKCVECGSTSVINIKYLINGTKVVTDLRGNTNQGDTVQVCFTIVAGAEPTRLTLVSYTAPSGTWVVGEASQQKIFDLDTGVFGPGTYTLEVNIPNSFYQIDFVCGAAIDVLGPEGSNIFYSAQRRLFSADNDGTQAVITNAASLSGVVFVDSSNFGVRDAGEVGIGGVKVVLTGTDKNGQAVNLTRYTKSDGSYLFNNLKAGTYIITETQPAGFTDGQEIVGTINGTKTGTVAADQFKAIPVVLGNQGINYNFGEKLTTAGSGASAVFQVDPLDITKSAIVVNGTSSTDVIAVSYANYKYTVTLNGTTLATLNNKDASNRGVCRLIVNGNAGNDDIRIDSSVTVMTEVYGGEGHDRLIGGGGNNILVGGNGNDYVMGNNSLRDLILGGNGSDVINGGGADDLVIAGVTAFDSSPSALRSIFAEWNSARDYTTRVNNIRGTSPGTRANGNTFLAVDKVFDDGEVDTITGGGGRDWYLLHTGIVAKDVISDLASDEVSTDI